MFVAILSAAALVIICYYIYIYVKYASVFKHFVFFPYPLIGHASIFIDKPKADYVSKINKEISRFNKTPAAALIGHKLIWMVITPQDIEIISQHPNALKKSWLYKFFYMIEDGLFVTKDIEKWKKNRKLISSTLNQKVINSYVDVVSELSKEFLQKLDTVANTGELDIFPLIFDLSIDIITRTVFNVDLKQKTELSNLPEYIIKILHIVFGRILKPWIHPDIFFKLSPASRQLDWLTETVQSYILKMIKNEKEELHMYKDTLEFDDKRLKPTIKCLVELAEKEPNMTDKQILHELATLFVAGSDSTAITTSFALTLLGMHQNIQNEVYKELIDILGENDRPIIAEDLPKMKLLERVIKETLRLFPAGPLTGRSATGDIKLNDYVIHRGDEICIDIIFVQRCEKYWENPMSFDPDRFLPENFGKVHPFAFVPFGAGPRDCVGVRFGMMAMKVILASVLRKFKFEAKKVPLEDIRLSTDVVIKAADGNILSVEYRKPNCY